MPYSASAGVTILSRTQSREGLRRRRFFGIGWEIASVLLLVSAVHTAKKERLIAEGAMQRSGLAQVEAARADGRWERAYDGPRTAEVPPDLQAALDQDRAAADFFATVSSAN